MIYQISAKPSYSCSKDRDNKTMMFKTCTMSWLLREIFIGKILRIMRRPITLRLKCQRSPPRVCTWGMAAVSAKTLFFRNLPYRTTDSELEQACARYGTIKACFTVKDKGEWGEEGACWWLVMHERAVCHTTGTSASDRCRGFGYVTYHSR